VFGGNEPPSGQRSVSRRSDAFSRFGLKSRMPMKHQCRLYPAHITRPFSNQGLMLAVGSSSVFPLQSSEFEPSGSAWFSTQPTKQRTPSAIPYPRSDFRSSDVLRETGMLVAWIT